MIPVNRSKTLFSVFDQYGDKQFDFGRSGRSHTVLLDANGDELACLISESVINTDPVLLIGRMGGFYAGMLVVPGVKFIAVANKQHIKFTLESNFQYA
ncbi:MAG: hypothetical protein WD317_11520 [Balneolaceae bacterium]